VLQLLTESVVLAGMGGSPGSRWLCGHAHAAEAGVSGAQNMPIHPAFGHGSRICVRAVAIDWHSFRRRTRLDRAQAKPAEALRSGMRTTAGALRYCSAGWWWLQAALSFVLLVGADFFRRA